MKWSHVYACLFGSLCTFTLALELGLIVDSNPPQPFQICVQPMEDHDYIVVRSSGGGVAVEHAWSCKCHSQPWPTTCIPSPFQPFQVEIEPISEPPAADPKALDGEGGVL